MSVIMSYRSERFEPINMPGLAQAWAAIDELEARGLPVAAEVMAGTSYRRQLHHAVAANNRADYVLQATFQIPPRDDDIRMASASYITAANTVLDTLALPTVVLKDEGGLSGLLPGSKNYPTGSTGVVEDDVLHIYAPWRKSRWFENGKGCLFFCGILPPTPKRLFEDYEFDWSESRMQQGIVVFEPTPTGLETY